MRHSLARLVLVVGLLAACFAAPAFAPAQQPAPEPPHAADGPAAGDGHPANEHTADGPLNPLAFAADLGLWSLVVFVLLLLILRKAAWGPIVEGLQKREQAILGSVEEARRTREEMERLRAAFKTELDAAHAQIPALMDEARRDAAAMSEKMRKEAAEEIEAHRKRVLQDLAVAHDQALQELWSQAAQVATLISAKAIGRSLNEDDHRRLVNEAIAEIGQGNGRG